MAADARDQAREIGERLARAGLAAPWAESVVVDLANDPPLGRSLAAIAVEESARVVAGIGAAMIASRARSGVIAVGDAAAHKAIDAALREAGSTTVRVERVPDVYPTRGLDRDLGCHYAWILDGERLLDLEAAAFATARAPRRVTVAGAVRTPSVVSVPAGAPLAIEQLVAACGGATVEPWLPLDGGAWSGRLADPEAPPATALVLVLAADHALVQRARVSVEDQLRRAASACEGCRLCTDACPVYLDGSALAPHQIVASLAQGLDGLAHLAGAAACIHCGVCDATCPATIIPAALVAAVKSRLPPMLEAPQRGDSHPDRGSRRISRELLLLRAGLGG